MIQSAQIAAPVTPAFAAPRLDLPMYGASLFRTLLQFVFALFSVAFRRDAAAPAPEAPLLPASVPDLATLQSQKITLYDSIIFSTPSISSTLSTSSTASTRSALSSRLDVLFRSTGLMAFRALARKQSPSSSIRNPQLFCLLTPVSWFLPSAFPIPHSFHPPPPS